MPGAAMQSFSRSYEAEPRSVAAARRDVARFAYAASAREQAVDDLRLAVSEAVTNAVRHAYPSRVGEIRIEASSADGQIEVTVSDDGCGVNADSDRGGLGIGLSLICELSDQMVLTPRSGRGTDVRIRLRALGSGSGAAVGRL